MATPVPLDKAISDLKELVDFAKRWGTPLVNFPSCNQAHLLKAHLLQALCNSKGPLPKAQIGNFFQSPDGTSLLYVSGENDAEKLTLEATEYWPEDVESAHYLLVREPDSILKILRRDGRNHLPSRPETWQELTLKGGKAPFPERPGVIKAGFYVPQEFSYERIFDALVEAGKKVFPPCEEIMTERAEVGTAKGPKHGFRYEARFRNCRIAPSDGEKDGHALPVSYSFILVPAKAPAGVELILPYGDDSPDNLTGFSIAQYRSLATEALTLLSDGVR